MAEHFKKYDDIENSYRGKWVQQVQAHALQEEMKVTWDVQEKIHGSNFSIIYDVSAETLTFAKRTSVLEENATFFNFAHRKGEWSELMCNLVDLLPEATTYITVWGELCGGKYLNMKPNHKKVKPVQKGVEYSPNLEFFVFDVVVDGAYLDLNRALELAKQAGFHVIPVLASFDTLQEALQYPNAFQSGIPVLLDLPKHSGDNVCEGVVIKARKTFYVKGRRAVFKNKNETFAEKQKAPRKPRKPKEQQPTPFPELMDYVTVQRYDNVVSKLGPDANIGELGRTLAEDVVQDYRKDHEEETNEKELYRSAARLAFPLVKAQLHHK